MDLSQITGNEKFFNPLSSRNKQIYFDCICRLIEKSKEVPVMYDADARDIVALYLKNSALQFQQELGDETATDSPEQNVSLIMRRFRECGWLTAREIGRNGEYVTNVTVVCRRVIDFLKKLGERTDENQLSNHVLSMYDILKSASDPDSARKDRPYSLILKPLLGHMEDLKNELLDLKDSISGIMVVVQEMQSAKSLGSFFMKDELLDRFFKDYFFVKNNGLIPIQMRSIRSMLRAMESGPLFEKMVQECAETELLQKSGAEEKVAQGIEDLRYYLTVEYDENMDLIDSRINTYYKLANTRLLLVMNGGVNLESALDQFLSKLKHCDETVRKQTLQQVAECTRIVHQSYISTQSFAKRQRKESAAATVGMEQVSLSEAEKKARTEEIFHAVSNRFSLDKTSAYFADRLAGLEQITLHEQVIKNREDALMYMAAMMYSDSEDFPYEVELLHQDVEIGFASISDMIVRRKGGR